MASNGGAVSPNTPRAPRILFKAPVIASTQTLPEVLDGSLDNDHHSDSSNSDDSSKRRGKKPSACARCKHLKVLCDRSQGGRKCKRCTDGNHECVPRGRKKRKPAPLQEQLQERSNARDAKIQDILRALDTEITSNRLNTWINKARSRGLPVIPYPLCYNMVQSYELHLVQSYELHHPLPTAYALRYPQQSVSEHAYSSRPRRGFDMITPPNIIRIGVVTPGEAIELFKLYFENINPFFSLLDPDFHTPQELAFLNPFLFTVICACALQYSTKSPEIYRLAMEIASHEAAQALTYGAKTIETCQAYLILAVYPVPRRKWADDRSWEFMGIAIRLAQELKLDRPPPEHLLLEAPRQAHNQIRTWLNCFCVDASHATQFGKLPVVQSKDYVACRAVAWYNTSQIFNHPFDIHLAGYTDFLQLMLEFRETVGAADELDQKFREGFQIVERTMDYDKRLSELIANWVVRYKNDPNVNLCPYVSYRMTTSEMIGTYLRLVLLSVGFQYAVKRGVSRDSYVVQTSISTAIRVIRMMIEQLYPTGSLRYAMSAHFLYVTFAAAFLLNLFRPKFLPLVDLTQSTIITKLVQDLIDRLSSSDVSIGGRHAPAVYAKFLSSLLAKHRPPEASPVNAQGSPEIVAQYDEYRQQSPPYAYQWPYTRNTLEESAALNEDYGSMIRQEVGEPDMDFSMQFLLDTVSTQYPPSDEQVHHQNLQAYPLNVQEYWSPYFMQENNGQAYFSGQW